MKKTYARIYNVVNGKSVEIGGTAEQVEKDLKDMEKKNLVNDDCTVDIYTVEY